MSKRPWRVDGRHTDDHVWDPELPRFGSAKTAGYRAAQVKQMHPEWHFRLVNRDTGEVIPL